MIKLTNSWSSATKIWEIALKTMRGEIAGLRDGENTTMEQKKC